MRSQDSLPSGLGLDDADDPIGVPVDNVTPLFAPRVGSVAALVAAAGGPTEPEELQGEQEMRAMFRSVMAETPSSLRRRRKLAPFAIAAGSVAGLVAGTAGLSAAAVLPPAATHVVVSVLRQVGIDVAPAPAPRAAASSNRGSGTAVESPAPKSPRPTTTSPPPSTSVASSHAHVPTPPAIPANTHVAPSHVVTPPPVHTPATPMCEVALIEHQVVLLRLPASSSATAKPAAIPNALPLGAPGPCSNRQLLDLEKAAVGNGTGSGKGPHHGGTGTGSGRHSGHHGTTGGGAGTGTGSGTGAGTGTGPTPGSGTPTPGGTGSQTTTQPLA